MILKCLASGSNGNCYLLESANEVLILDCGIPIMDIKKGLNFNLRNVVGCIVTHSHQDHSLSADKLEKMGIPVSKPYKGYGICLRNNSKFRVQVVEMTDLQGKWTHTNADGSECVCYGFLISHPEMGKMLYATDTAFIKWRFKGLNHILLGVNYDKSMIKDMDERKSHVLTGHMELQTAKDFIRSNLNDDLRNIILCHLSEANADEEHFITEMKKVANCPICVAHKGMEITLQNGECPF